MTLDDLVQLAVAISKELRPAAETRLRLAFPELVPAAPPVGKTVVGGRSEVRKGKRFETDFFADGTQSPERQRP